jgi:hypothetical protein
VPTPAKVTTLLVAAFLLLTSPAAGSPGAEDASAVTTTTKVADDTTHAAPPARSPTLSPWTLGLNATTATSLMPPYGETFGAKISLGLPTPEKWSASFAAGSSVYVNEELSSGPGLTFEVSVSRQFWSSD